MRAKSSRHAGRLKTVREHKVNGEEGETGYANACCAGKSVCRVHDDFKPVTFKSPRSSCN